MIKIFYVNGISEASYPQFKDGWFCFYNEEQNEWVYLSPFHVNTVITKES